MTIFTKAWDPLKNQIFTDVISIAKSNNCQIYLVGGYIRDALLNKNTNPLKPFAKTDLDFAVLSNERNKEKSAIELAKTVASKLSAHFVLLDECLDIARVVFEDGEIYDFASCIGNTIEEDLARRDFTINSLAWDPVNAENKLIDLFNGIKDLEAGNIRCIGEENLLSDPLRLLRAYRFAAVLGFSIDQKTNDFICKHQNKLSSVASERINHELFTFLASENSALHIKDMGNNGLLETIFPELSQTRKVTPNNYHHLALFDHSVEALIQCEKSVKDMPDWAQESYLSPLSSGINRLAVTKLASLLHDIGKPDTWAITEDGKHTFIGHDKLGAELCAPIAKRMKWPRPVERLIEKLVRWHLRPGALFHQSKPTEKAIFRFYRTISVDTPELILLALADFRATCGPGLITDRQTLENNLFDLLNQYFIFRNKQDTVLRLLDGNEVMKLLSIAPGPMVGQIIEDLTEAQALGEINSWEQAKEYVCRIYREKYCQ